MRRGAALWSAGAFSALLYLLFYYVPISDAHTREVIAWRPLGAWSIGSPVGLAIYYAAILAALFGLYAFAFRRGAVTGDSAGARRAVYAGAAVFAAILVFTPSLLSKEVFDDIGQGRVLAAHRANPYMTPASAFPEDEILKSMRGSGSTTPHGPCWVSACGLLSSIAPGSVPASVIVFKILFLAVHLTNGVIIGALLRGWGRAALPGEILYLWNPLVLLQTIGEAHNGAFMIFWVLLGLLFLQRRRAGSFSDEAFGVICLSVSALVKLVTAPIILFALGVLSRERRGSARWIRLSALAGVAAATFVLGYLPYASGIDLRGVLRPYQHGPYEGSALMILEMVLAKVLPAGEGGSPSAMLAPAMSAAGALLAIAVVVMALWLTPRALRLEDLPGFSLRVLLFYLLAATPSLRISHGVWIVALAPLAIGPARRAALLMSGSLFALEIYWVWAIRMMGIAVPLHLPRAIASAVALGVPALYLLAVFVRRRAAARAD